MEPSQIVSGSGLAFVGIFAAVGVISAVLLVFIIVVVANRAEPDPRGLRPYSVYLFGMTFVTLSLTYSGVSLIVTSLLSFIGPHDLPIADSVARTVVIGALLVAIAGGTMAYHLRRGLAIVRGDSGPNGPNARILHTYVSAVTFIYFLSMIVSFGIAIYFLLELIGPGIFGSIGGGTAATVRTLLDVVYVMLASGVVVLAHSKFTPATMRTAVPAATAAAEPVG